MTSPDAECKQAIIPTPKPLTKRQIMGVFMCVFLRVTNYIRAWIPNYEEVELIYGQQMAAIDKITDIKSRKAGGKNRTLAFCSKSCALR